MVGMRCFDAVRYALVLVPVGFFVACGGATRIGGDEDGGAGGSSGSSGGTAARTGGVPGAGASMSAGGTPSTGATTSTGGYVSAGGYVSTGGSYGTGGTTSSTGGSPAGGSPAIYARDYDQSCKFDSDCAVVSEGPLCDCDGCDNAAINVDSVSKWDASLQNGMCGVVPPCAPVFCPARVPACVKGTCTARINVQLDTKSYDHACKVDADCTLIKTQVCAGGCGCGADAVSKTGFEQYQKEIAGIECTPSPIVCDCASPDKAVCTIGTAATGTCQATF